MNEQYQRLEKKAKDILVSNVYEPNKYPWGAWRLMSPCKKHFEGVWNWDSAFHAMTVSRYDERLAKSCIDTFVKYMLPNGMLPDVIWLKGDMADNFGKPPVMP